MRRLIVLVLISLAGVAPALAFDPYVDASSGSDANDGSFNSPVKTIKKALTLVTANGTIHVRPGMYNTALGETFPITMPSGIKLLSTAGAATTIIDATGANARVFLCNANSNTTLIEGFTITGGFYQPPVDGSNATGGAIFMDNNDQTTIKRCIIAGNTARGYDGAGLTFRAGGLAYGGAIGINNGVHLIVNTVFRGNISRGGNGSSPVDIGYPGGDAHGGAIWDGAGTTTLINDTFVANQSIGGNGANATSGNSAGGGGGVALYTADIGNGTSINTIFANNVDTGGAGGLGFGGGANGANGNAFGALSATVADYNLFFSNGGGDGFTGTNALTGSDPLFVNPPVNVHLQSASPAKYAGKSSSNPGVDLENNPRPSTPSMGAYELGLFLTATPGIGRVTISWAGVSGATSYNLYYISGGGTVTTGSAKISVLTSPYVFAPVLDGTTWSFAMTAVESTVEGPLGPQATATVSGGPGGPWVPSPTIGTSFTNIARDLANANILYASATDSVGLYKSTDAGDTWTGLTGPFNGLGMHAVAANGSNVLVAGVGAIYRSMNGGTTWTTSFSGAGIGEDFINSLAIDPLNTNTVYAGDFHIDFGTTSSYLVIKSTDGGTTFHNLTDMSAANLRAYFLQVDPVTSGTLYAAGSGSPNVGKSVNSAGTWTSVSPVAGYPTALALAPNLIVRLYAGMKDVDNSTVLGVYRSNNSGQQWTPINTGLGGGVINALLVDPLNADHVHAGASDGYYVSTDGTNWNAGAAGAGSHFINAFSQTTTRRLIATTTNNLIIQLPLDPAPTINANASPGNGNTAGGDTVVITGTGFNIAAGLRVLFGGRDGTFSIPSSTSTSIQATTPWHTAGSVDIAVINPDGQAAIRTNGFVYTAGTMTLNAVASSGQVALSWTSAGVGATYDVRKSFNGVPFFTVTTVSTTNYTDLVSNGIGFLYEIVANTGAYSNIDLAVPMNYTDPSLGVGTVIKAAHFNELRIGVNAARAAIGSPALTFTDTLNSALAVKRIHLIELRTALDAVRSYLGLTPVPYMDSAITAGSTPVRAQHILDLRGGLQ